jgi:Family of unknown function (DUF6350)
VRRVWAGIGQAVESAAIAAVGLVLCALVLLAVWGIDQGFGGDPLLQWRIAVDAWMLGHGVDVGISLGTEAAAALGLESAGRAFVLTLGAWGIGAITFLLHWRSGRRLAELPLVDTVIAVVTGTAATGLVGLLAGMSAQHPTAAPNLGQAFAHPALIALVGMVAAIVAVRGHDWLQALARALTIDDVWLRPVRAAMRAGLGGALGVLGIGALLVAAGLFLRFTEGLLIMESLEVTHVGVAVLFLVQLALAPVAVVWGAAWAIGPGFMVGRGSSVSPLDTDLGPVPALPMLSAIDPDVQPWMLVVVALPVLAAVVVGALARQTLLAGSVERPVHWWELAIAGVGGGVLAGTLLGVAAMLSVGAAGPGRLSLTGPDAVLVAAWGALEVGAGLLIGLLAGGRGTGRLAGGIALPLAAERDGTSMREVLGFGRSRDDEPVDGATDADADPADEDADPADAAGEQETEAVVPLVLGSRAADPAASPEDVVPIAGEAETQAVEPLVRGAGTQAVEPAADAAGGDGSGATDGSGAAGDGDQPTHPEHRPEGDDPER